MDDPLVVFAHILPFPCRQPHLGLKPETMQMGKWYYPIPNQ